jgi:hypothetical protein
MYGTFATITAAQVCGLCVHFDAKESVQTMFTWKSGRDEMNSTVYATRAELVRTEEPHSKHTLRQAEQCKLQRTIPLLRSTTLCLRLGACQQETPFLQAVCNTSTILEQIEQHQCTLHTGNITRTVELPSLNIRRTKWRRRR